MKKFVWLILAQLIISPLSLASLQPSFANLEQESKITEINMEAVNLDKMETELIENTDNNLINLETNYDGMVIESEEDLLRLMGDGASIASEKKTVTETSLKYKMVLYIFVTMVIALALFNKSGSEGKT